VENISISRRDACQPSVLQLIRIDSRSAELPTQPAIQQKHNEPTNKRNLNNAIEAIARSGNDPFSSSDDATIA
jgi:hypothetical protein